MRWIAEFDDQHEEWTPTLEDDGIMLSLPIWFESKHDCEQYIREIPAGALIDGSQHGTD